MTIFVASAHLLYAGMTDAIQNAVNMSLLYKKIKKWHVTTISILIATTTQYTFWKKFLYSGLIDLCKLDLCVKRLQLKQKSVL